MTEGTRPGGRPTLDQARLVAVALALLDEVGLDGLTMRQLAHRLGVTAASLYWHVRDKDELLGLLADAISAEIPLPDPNRGWREELEAFARGSRRVVLAHRDGARVLVGTIPAGPNRLRRVEAVFELLRRAGFGPQDIADGSYLLNVYLTGFVLDEAMSPGADRHSHATRTGHTASLGSLPAGRLVLQGGASNLTIRGAASSADLYRVTFEGREPQIEVRDGTVRIKQQHGRRTSCEVTLNGAIPWDLEIEGGAYQVTADLVHLRPASFRVSGGVSDCTLRLPSPSGTVPVRIGGGLRRLRIERPPDAPIQVHMRRGASRLTLDELHLSTVGGGTRWESQGYTAADDRYEVEIGGGSNELTVTTRRIEPAESGSRPAETPEAGLFDSLPADEYPNLVALAGRLQPPGEDRLFEVGLQIFLDGLERRLAAGQERAPTDPTARPAPG